MHGYLHIYMYAHTYTHTHIYMYTYSVNIANGFGKWVKAVLQGMRGENGDYFVK
jgi:hypothetical protein